MSTKTIQIPREELVPGRYYVGRGRHANVGRWTGHYFLTIGEKLGRDVVKKEPYYTPETGCFQPFLPLDEGWTLAPVGTSGWDKFYAGALEFQREKPGYAPLEDVFTREGAPEHAGEDGLP